MHFLSNNEGEQKRSDFVNFGLDANLSGLIGLYGGVELTENCNRIIWVTGVYVEKVGTEQPSLIPSIIVGKQG